MYVLLCDASDAAAFETEFAAEFAAEFFFSARSSLLLLLERENRELERDVTGLCHAVPPYVHT